MFENNDEYLKAIRDAQVHSDEKRGVNLKLIFINIGLILTLIALVVFYLKKDTKSQLPAQKVAVLGVSYTSSKSEFSHDNEEVSNEEFSNEELMDILDDVEVDNATEKQKVQSHNSDNSHLYDAMSQLVEATSIKSQSKYKEAISHELEEEEPFRGRVVIVKKGDTLSSLADEYYGNAMAFDRIIEHNQEVLASSHTLHVGEKIKIVY